MRFSKVFLAPVLAWTAAAAAIHGNARDDSAADLISSRATSAKVKVAPPMYAELAKAVKSGKPANFPLPKAPTKGKKVTKRDPAAIPADDNDYLLIGHTKRAVKTASMNEVVTGTAADTVGTSGLGPCIGVIVTFGKVSAGKVNKIVAHLGAAGGAAANTKMVKEIWDAAVEGGVWDTDLDADHRPQIHVSYPNVDAEMAFSVQQGWLQQAQVSAQSKLLKDVISQVTTNLNSICSTLQGHCYARTRSGTPKTAGSSMQSTADGVVTIDGVAL